MKEWIDITREINEAMPVYPGDRPFTRERQYLMERGEFCNLTNFAMSSHGGTHVDAPLHFIAGGTAIDQVGLDRFFGPARVLEFDTEQPVTVDALRQYNIVAGERILLKVGANETGNETAQAQATSVGLQLSAADYLVSQGVALVGINRDSIEPDQGDTFEVHQRLLGAGIPILENLVLAGVQPGEYCLACFPLKIQAGEASPVRAVLMR